MQLSDVDSLLCGVQRHVRQCSAAQLEELPVRPASPEPWQCCGQSCRPCVFDLHRSDLHEWAVQCGSQLKAPELRELVDRVRPPSQLDLQLPNGAVWAGKRTRLRLSNVQQFTENLALYSFLFDDLPDNGPSHCRKQLVSLPICGHITLKLGGVSRQMTPLVNDTDNFDVDSQSGRILLRGGVMRFLIKHCDTLLAFSSGTGLAPLTHLLNERTLGTECSPQLRYRIVLCVPKCEQVGLAQWVRDCAQWWNVNVVVYCSRQSPVETEFDWCENIDVHFSKLDETAAKIELEKCRGKVQVLACGSKSFEKDVTKWIRLVQVGKALGDAKVSYEQLQLAAVGYIYGSSCCGQRALYPLGMTGIPIFNVNNACASGSSAMLLCKQLVAGGSYDLALAVGFEKMARGSLENMAQYTDRANPAERHLEVMSDTYGLEPAPITAQMFTMAGREHMEKYGTKREHFAKIAYKNHKHSVNNPDAQFQKEYSMEEILNSRQIYNFLTMLECSPTSDGSAAVVLCSEKWLQAHPQLQGQAVEILGMQLTTDLPSAFEEKSNIKMVGFDAAKLAAEKLYAETKYTVHDVQAIELHDCFSPNELITYEALGMCGLGEGGRLADSGDTTYGGKWVVNPSGGLIAKGHPIGATGVSQCVELCKHLRGMAGARQVPNCERALQHNIGIGGACALSMYARPQPLRHAALPRDAPALQSAFQEGAAMAAKVNSSFQIIIEGPGGATKKWLVKVRPGDVFVGQKEEAADVQLRMSDEVFVQLATGKVKGEQAFMQGKMKVKGNMAKVLKLRDVIGAQALPAKL